MTMKFSNTDMVTVGDERPVTLQLSHEPLPGSLHLHWNGLSQPASEFKLDGQTVTFQDGEDAVEAGDEIWATYAYDG
jgi:hypothetical protein